MGCSQYCYVRLGMVLVRLTPLSIQAWMQKGLMLVLQGLWGLVALGLGLLGALFALTIGGW